MKQNRALVLALVWLLVMAAVVGSTVTLLASDGGLSGKRWVSREEYALIERYGRLDEVRSTLSDKFYRVVDEETLINGALKGMMASVQDDYTFYYTPDEMAAQMEQGSGAYKGVGLLVQNNEEGNIQVIRVYSGGPADAAGILTGDLIIAVDGADVSGANAETLEAAVSRMKGEDGSEVTVSVLRGGERMDFTLVRGDVTINNVCAGMIEGDIGYIEIWQFSGAVVEDFEKALNEMLDAGAKALVIDVRSNPGGNLDYVVEIADMLLGEGEIVYTLDREGRRNDFYSDAEHCDLPLAVLVNGMSASASEILAAAVQDHERGIVVGEQTYGKGIVQTLVTFESDGAGMQYTSECYYTPNGKDIHGVGVAPDVQVAPQEGFANFTGVPDMENDAQLKKAAELLRRNNSRISG